MALGRLACNAGFNRRGTAKNRPHRVSTVEQLWERDLIEGARLPWSGLMNAP